MLPPHSKKVHNAGDLARGHVGIQSNAGAQGREDHPVDGMTEGRAVEIETQRINRVATAGAQLSPSWAMSCSNCRATACGDPVCRANKS